MQAAARGWAFVAAVAFPSWNSPRLIPSVPNLGVGEATQITCIVNSIPCATHEDHLW